MRFRDFFRRKSAPRQTFGDDASRNHAAELVANFIAHHHRQAPQYPYDAPATPEIEAAEPEVQALVLLEVSARLHGIQIGSVHERSYLTSLFSQLVRRKLPLTGAQLCQLLREGLKPAWGHYVSPGVLLTRVEQYLQDNELDDELRAALEAWAKRFHNSLTSTEDHRLAARARRMIGDDNPIEQLVLEDEWAKRAVRDVLRAEAGRDAWVELLAHAGSAAQSKPSKKWLKAATPLLNRVGFDAFHQAFTQWAEGVGMPGTKQVRFEPHNVLLDDRNTDTLRGLVWCYTEHPSSEHAALIGELAARCFKKVRDYGALNTKVGNACLYVLGQMPGDDAVMQLSRLHARAKLPSIRKQVNQALDAAAVRAGVTTDVLEEIATPSYGLDANGRREQQFGEFTAVLEIAGTGTTLTWRREDGKSVKSIPKAVREAFPDGVKELRKAAKEIQSTLGTVRIRLERIPLLRRTWNVPTWRGRYLDHGLVGTLARRLIWEFRASESAEPRLAAWHDGALVDVNGQPFKLDAADTVTLWHPVGSSVETIRAWRDWLEQRSITQPFKQAHREVYIVTPAEVETDTYSNRFAAHILRQHQVNALAQPRGWKVGLMGAFDSENTPKLYLPQWNISAEFFLEYIDGNDNLSPAGILLHVSSDQVRFRDGGGPMSVVDVPPTVFSEVMRDIDLFVGVASIGNDPNWRDQGDRHHTYWYTYSFGELSETARTRYDVLERLLPRLKIADRCELVDRFLVVRGALRTYKIHLGSGNILMEPGGQYLCIVPAREEKAGGKLYLPFEGDPLLAIILSKAFLLAADTQIKDRSIVRQIKRDL